MNRKLRGKRISERYYEELCKEFDIYAAESGMDREGCFDPESQLHKYISKKLGTDDWFLED